MPAPEPEISVVPANEASWADLQAVFGARGQTSRCQCQRYKLWSRDYFESVGMDERAGSLREQTDCGHPRSGTTSGLVARALEGYPMTTRNAIEEELHVGTVRTFADAGLTEVSRPTKRRAVMRIDL